MSNEAKEATVQLERITVIGSLTESDRKFILAIVVVAAYIVMIGIPIVTNNVELFKTVATALTGVVGTIIGYYFGSKKE